MSTQISWDDQRLFLAVLEEGSLSAAARRLALSQPTVRVRIERLERSLGTVLFTRSANGLAPTNEALALHEPARAMAMASEHFVRLASAPVGEIGGTVRLSVPEFMGVEIVPWILADLRKAHPAIQIELSLSNGAGQSAGAGGRSCDPDLRSEAGGTHIPQGGVHPARLLCKSRLSRTPGHTCRSGGIGDARSDRVGPRSK